ncbi:hypothetical protein OG892_01710 [Streptomyces sp. NBC_00341]|uniref:hypothetical protein n=1 Tax=unclassified Streptomyces TaxID=2593676 RepID=UPI0030859626|nr:hypothetical protein OG892_01710 [Streptomyces sp. NBC_00341]
MRVFKKPRVVAVAAGAACALAAGAVAVSLPDTASAARAAAPVAVAPYARAAAVVNASGKLLRGKGVASVQRVAVGEYCVKISASGFDISTGVSQATPNLGTSRNPILELTRSKRPECGNSAKSILVVTIQNGGRKDQPFTLVVL